MAYLTVSLFVDLSIAFFDDNCFELLLPVTQWPSDPAISGS